MDAKNAIDAIKISTQMARKKELIALYNSLLLFAKIEEQKIYSHLKFESLYHFGISFLKLSEDESYKRCRVIMLKKIIPNIFEEILSGAISLNNASKFEQFIRRHQINIADCVEKILPLIRNKTSKECNHILNNFIPYYAPPMDSIRPLFNDLKRLNATISDCTAQKVRKIKNLLYRSGQGTFEELISTMADHTLNKINQSPTQKNKITTEKHSRYVSKNIRAQVWKRAKGICENCGSDFSLEIDHVIPFAKGGTNDLWNLRLLCRNCNQRAKIEVFGVSNHPAS